MYIIFFSFGLLTTNSDLTVNQPKSPIMFLYFRHEPINAPVTTNISLLKNADTQAKFELVFPFK